MSANLIICMKILYMNQQFKFEKKVPKLKITNFWSKTPGISSFCSSLWALTVFQLSSKQLLNYVDITSSKLMFSLTAASSYKISQNQLIIFSILNQIIWWNQWSISLSKLNLQIKICAEVFYTADTAA